MTPERKWDKIVRRNWEQIRDAWLDHVPSFSSIGAIPDPGLEHLTALLTSTIPEIKGPPARFQDIEGMRRNALWEAVFLFHKCSHTHLAAQRLGERGMHSWCMFNAYHSAYLGAKGIMGLLGVALPNLAGKQVAVDLFPEPVKRSKKAGISPRFLDFLMIRLPLVEQRHLWQGFQRMLRISKVDCWDGSLVQELIKLSWDEFSPARNHFLYQAHFWPLHDLISDRTVEEMERLIGDELDRNDQGFLLRLSFCVYRLFEQLMTDLGERSSGIREQLSGSRAWVDSAQPELAYYRSFVSQIVGSQHNR